MGEMRVGGVSGPAPSGSRVCEARSSGQLVTLGPSRSCRRDCWKGRKSHYKMHAYSRSLPRSTLIAARLTPWMVSALRLLRSPCLTFLPPHRTAAPHQKSARPSSSGYGGGASSSS